MDPATMQQMLMQQLQQGPQAGSFGGGTAGPQMQGSINPLNAAANLTQKLMLMKALQKGAPPTPQQQAQANGMVPGTNAQVAADPTMQALQQSPQMQPAINPQVSIAPPNSQPTPGYS
jgi:hypothetical protein